ncbi:MAG: DUF2799 domain-containing protein [Paracoccaceae bacterium]|nr:DUF2799 domain-containing protein [Paracoccaceae bacterium]
MQPTLSRSLLQAAALTLALSLGGCATATVAERAAACQATDWASYGENDGLLGVAPGARSGKFTDCAELGYPADQAAYDQGRARGLESYCTLENGYQVGIEGRRYRKACPPELEPAFLQGYEQGRKDRPAGYYPRIGFGLGIGLGHSNFRRSHFGYGQYYPWPSTYLLGHRRRGNYSGASWGDGK